MGRRIRPKLSITDGERSKLKEVEKVLKESGSSQRYLKRVQIILSRYDGVSQEETAKRVGISRVQVVHWERRFRTQRIDGLKDRKRPGRKPWLDPHVKRAIVQKARVRNQVLAARWFARQLKRRGLVETRLDDRTQGVGMDYPSIRRVARVFGVSRGTVLRLWQRWEGRQETFFVLDGTSGVMLNPFSSGPNSLYWRSNSVTVGLGELRSALQVLFNSDLAKCRHLIEYLHIFDTVSGPNLKRSLGEGELRGGRISLKCDHHSVAGVFETASAIGLQSFQRTLRDRLRSYATGRKAWIEVIVDWNKLITHRPPLAIPEGVQHRIERQIPKEAELQPWLRFVSLILPLNEHPRAARKPRVGAPPVIRAPRRFARLIQHGDMILQLVEQGESILNVKMALEDMGNGLKASEAELRLATHILLRAS